MHKGQSLDIQTPLGDSSLTTANMKDVCKASEWLSDHEKCASIQYLVTILKQKSQTLLPETMSFTSGTPT